MDCPGRLAAASTKSSAATFNRRPHASFTSFCMQRISSSAPIGVPRLRIAVRDTSPT